MRTTLGAVSALMAAGCAMFFVFALHDWIVGDGKTDPGVLLGLTVFFGFLTLMCAGSAYRMLFATKPPPAAAAVVDVDDVEQSVLALAATNEGKVTVAEVALHAAVPLEKAEAVLDGLARRGRADVEVSSSGQTVYAVRGLLSREEKRSARDPIA